jgi:hypothetical protein
MIIQTYLYNPLTSHVVFIPVDVFGFFHTRCNKAIKKNNNTFVRFQTQYNI